MSNIESNTEHTPESKSNSLLCNIYLEEFVEIYKIALTEECPDCGIRGTRHNRTPISGSTGITSNSGSLSKQVLNPASAAFIKLSNQFPQFDKNSDTRTFIKRLELILDVNLGDTIKKNDWPRAFIYCVKENSSAEWIKSNIIDKNLSWEDSKKIFVSHFQRAEYNSLIIKKFKSCKQLPHESVQSYSDRYVDICSELDRSDNDQLVLEHYLDGLHSDIHRKFENFLAMKRVEQDDVSILY